MFVGIPLKMFFTGSRRIRRYTNSIRNVTSSVDKLRASACTSHKKFQKSGQLENNDKLKRPWPDGNPRQARIYTVIIKIHESGTNEKILTMMNRTTRDGRHDPLIRFIITRYLMIIKHFLTAITFPPAKNIYLAPREIFKHAAIIIINYSTATGKKEREKKVAICYIYIL